MFNPNFRVDFPGQKIDERVIRVTGRYRIGGLIVVSMVVAIIIPVIFLLINNISFNDFSLSWVLVISIYLGVVFSLLANLLISVGFDAIILTNQRLILIDSQSSGIPRITYQSFKKISSSNKTDNKKTWVDIKIPNEEFLWIDENSCVSI